VVTFEEAGHALQEEPSHQVLMARTPACVHELTHNMFATSNEETRHALQEEPSHQVLMARAPACVHERTHVHH